MLVLVALIWCNCAQAAEPRVLLLRGWFGVFSTGMDSLADELRANGIDAQVAGHLHWAKAVEDILRERSAGRAAPLILVGHSQGGNNVIDIARALEPHHVTVDLIVTLAPFMQDPVPGNVLRAVDYYQSPGWGAPLAPGRGFRGSLSNIDVANDLSITDITIDTERESEEQTSARDRFFVGPRDTLRQAAGRAGACTIASQAPGARGRRRETLTYKSLTAVLISPGGFAADRASLGSAFLYLTSLVRASLVLAFSARLSNLKLCARISRSPSHISSTHVPEYVLEIVLSEYSSEFVSPIFASTSNSALATRLEDACGLQSGRRKSYDFLESVTMFPLGLPITL